jgi:hypothetical protein
MSGGNWHPREGYRYFYSIADMNVPRTAEHIAHNRQYVTVIRRYRDTALVEAKDGWRGYARHVSLECHRGYHQPRVKRIGDFMKQETAQLAIGLLEREYEKVQAEISEFNKQIEALKAEQLAKDLERVEIYRAIEDLRNLKF